MSFPADLQACVVCGCQVEIDKNGAWVRCPFPHGFAVKGRANHVVCHQCKGWLSLPKVGADVCPASDEFLTAVALMRDDE